MGAEQSLLAAAALPAPGFPAELQELHSFCLPLREDDALRKRRVRPGYDTMTNISTEEWIRTLRIIQKAVDGNPTLPLDWFKKRPIGSYLPIPQVIKPTPRHFLFASTAAIVLDQECSSCAAGISPSDPGPKRTAPYDHAWEAIKAVIEHMLLVDYGFGSRPLEFRKRGYNEDEWTKKIMPDFMATCRHISEFAAQCRTGVFPSHRACKEQLALSVLPNWSAQCYSDVALMCHWFHTRRREISLTEYTRGLTGYTGVVQEMIREIPKTGPGRLKRKLYVDIHIAIPKYVRIWRGCCAKQVVQAALYLASQHDISIDYPDHVSHWRSRTKCMCMNCLEDGNTQQASWRATADLHVAPPSYREAMAQSYGKLGGTDI